MGGCVKNGLTIHLQNILVLRSENIDYVLVSISGCIQDLKLSVVYLVGWVGCCVWVDGLKMD